MRILIDTNILLRAVQRKLPAGKSSIQALRVLHRQQNILCLAPQNIIEFWSVCTRPTDVNGLGLSTAGTDRYVTKLKRLFMLIHDSLHAFETWHRLVVQYGVAGAKVHDARLVAIMKVHGLSTVLTFNVKDFSRYDGIIAIHPDSVKMK